MTSKKQELLDAEDIRWRELCARLDKLATGEWEKPGLNGDWCPKDLLAHIAAWHALTTDRLESFRSTGVWPEPPDIDAFNAEQADRCRTLSLHDVKAMSGASRHRFREEIGCAEEPFSERMERVVESNGHGHYDDHIPDLDAFLEAR